MPVDHFGQETSTSGSCVESIRYAVGCQMRNAISSIMCSILMISRAKYLYAGVMCVRALPDVSMGDGFVTRWIAFVSCAQRHHMADEWLNNCSVFETYVEVPSSLTTLHSSERMTTIPPPSIVALWQSLTTDMWRSQLSRRWQDTFP